MLFSLLFELSLFDISIWQELFFRFYAIIINQEYIVVLICAEPTLTMCANAILK